MGSNYVEILTEILDKNDFDNAIKVITDTPYESHLKKDVWGLLHLFFGNIRKETPNDLRTCCEKLLEILAKRIEPEEVILEFVDEIDGADIVKFTFILKLLTISLPLCTENRPQFIQSTLTCIRTFLDEFIISDVDFISEEEYEEELINQLQDVVTALNSVLDYCTFFMLNEAPNSENGEIVTMLSAQLLQLYNVFLPISNNPALKPLYEVELRVISLMRKLVPDPFYLLQFVFARALNKYHPNKIKKNFQNSDLREICDDLVPVSEYSSIYEMESVIPNSSYAIYFYSVLCVDVQKTPCVYNPKYIFLSIAFLTTIFFDKNFNKTINKGLTLLQTILKLLENNKLERYELYFSFNQKILTQLNNIMVYSEVEATRKLAVSCFQNYIEKFDYEAKYLLLLNLRKRVDHSGTLGFLVTLLKDLISQSMEGRACTSHLKYYSGKLLYKIIAEYCFLKEGEYADLVQNADHVISSLNMLRFLVLRDKENKTGIRNFIDKIDNHFLKPLKNCVKSSKEFYEVTLQEHGKDAAHTSVSSDNKIELTINGKPFTELTKEQRENALRASLNAVDLISSLLLRVNECINEFI